MKINSCFDLKCFISFEEDHYKKLRIRKKLLKEMNVPTSHCVWSAIKEEEDSIKANLSSFQQLIIQATTFEGGDFARFLETLFFEFNKKDLRIFRIENNCSEKKVLFRKKKESSSLEDLEQKKEVYYFIGTPEQYERFIEHKRHLGQDSDLSQALLGISSSILLKVGNFSILSSNQMDRVEELFPNFSSVMESLIDCYLKYPKKTPHERLNMVLREYKGLAFSFLL